MSTSPYVPQTSDTSAPSPGSRVPTIGQPPVPTNTEAAPAPHPMYWRVLRLSAVRPNGWQRAVLVEGVVAVAVILTLADVATAWTLLVLPLVAAAVVKAHDYLARSMPPAPHGPEPVSDATTAGDPPGAPTPRM